MISTTEATTPASRVRGVHARPTRTSAGTFESAPLVLIDLLAEEGIVGPSYLYHLGIRKN